MVASLPANMQVVTRTSAMPVLRSGAFEALFVGDIGCRT
jgi:hypothetical protein